MRVRIILITFAMALVCTFVMLCLAQTPGRLVMKTKDNPSTSKATSYNGEARPMGNGQVHSWMAVDKNGNPTAIGVTFNESALIGLPQEPPPGLFGPEYTLPLPREADLTGFNHIGLDWNPHGHIPSHIYDVPHFDFHFYLISQGERDAIKVDPNDLGKFQKTPSPEFIPEGYILAPQSEYVRMGAHWIEPGSHEFHNQAFTATMIYGFYNGRMVFIEPMISKAFLETKPNITLPIKLPVKYQKAGFYPTAYSIKYNSATKEYAVALESLTYRQ